MDTTTSQLAACLPPLAHMHFDALWSGHVVQSERGEAWPKILPGSQEMAMSHSRLQLLELLPQVWPEFSP